MYGRIYDIKVFIVSALAVMFMQTGCVEFVEPETGSGDYLSFRVALDNRGSSVSTKTISEHFTIEEEEWPLSLSMEEAKTKAELVNVLNDYNDENGPSAGVFGYLDENAWEAVSNVGYTFDGDEMTAAAPPRWSTLPEDKGDKVRLYAYAPYIDGLTSNVIEIDDLAYHQYDYIAAASAEIPVDSEKSESVQLDFEHIYTAIQLKAGFDCNVTSVTVSGIRTSGAYTIGSGWSSTAEEGRYVIISSQRAVTKGDLIGDPVLMIPQQLSDNAKLTVVTTEGNYSVSLKGKEWEQGKLVTYMLNSPDDSKFIYFDLAAGDVTINASSYSGYVFVNSEKKEISGTHNSGNKYYVYQSCVTETNKSKGNYKVGYSRYDDVNKQGTGTLTLPSYEEVMYEGKRWRDFITNNTSVEAVIEAWDNSTGANGNTSIDVTKAVRTVGRESTQNLITVSGDVNECYLTLDNIYISNQHYGQNREWGSISFEPSTTSGSRLTLNVIGDNRVGCIHYDNRSKNDSDDSKNNYLIFEGSGSLTVADADFKTGSYNDKSGTGYYSNHYDSAIGNADDNNNCYGIVINSGVIFSGTTKAENCTAIGGGGNGYGEVIINGGVVTAVASTTGTAIGGGIGFSDKGGEGYVEINGGNVYAYNKDNGHDIPSSAIGGAGSNSSSGTKGTVKITDGNVYAESALGTAIGGGSSATRPGGSATVFISGGKVVAKGGTKEGYSSAGIGGGSSYTGSVGDGDGTKNGGDATITISGSPIIRTGSIGGGSPGKGKGNIGSAIINISGGDIQAQFVMADSENNVFDMTGGIVRNSDTSDSEYKCIQDNGGAVYMKVGTFKMSGSALIKKCSASKLETSKGGAVYIEGGKFEMSGGKIEQCSSSSDGGALYLEGGDVELTGGTISGNVALNGNGGAICINGGNFTMNGDVNVENNAAFDRNHEDTGNGGGIYITSSKELAVDLISGSITGNASGRYGGGVCVDMKDTEVPAVVNFGNAEENGVPRIDENSASLAGGGMYVYGSKASVVLNEGTVKSNSTSTHQVNPDIAVQGDGLVTLNADDITTQVKITFSNNNLYYTSGVDEEYYQYVVSATNNVLKTNEFEDLDPYYKNFEGWNTSRSRRGDPEYRDGATVNFTQNITLYAKWTGN